MYPTTTIYRRTAINRRATGLRPINRAYSEVSRIYPAWVLARRLIFGRVQALYTSHMAIDRTTIDLHGDTPARRSIAVLRDYARSIGLTRR